METKTVRLSFRGPIHLGKGRLSDSGNSFDAGTLFSALFIEALSAGVQNELLDATRNGELELSDAFPYVGNTLYLPKPMVAPDTFDKRNEEREGAPDSRERKANKKLAYVPASSYQDYLAGDFDSLSQLDQFKLGEASLQTKVNLTRSDGEDALPYFVGGYSFFAGSGLYFIVRGGFDLAPLLEQLSYTGLGGKRSEGYGRFEFSIEDGDPLPKRRATGDTPLGSWVLLATSIPSPDELNDDLLKGARYRLVRRGGFVQSTSHGPTPLKKRDMYLFAAGSTFDRRFEGDVFDVNATPGSHPVYRYAKAMWMEV